MVASFKKKVKFNLFIGHDLAIVRHVSDRVAVMYSGKILEFGSCDDLYDNSLHPYTQALLNAVPIPDPIIEEQRKSVFLKGEIPSPLNPPSGCRFYPRCPNATQECSHVVPTLEEKRSNHWVACIKT